MAQSLNAIQTKPWWQFGERMSFLFQRTDSSSGSTERPEGRLIIFTCSGGRGTFFGWSWECFGGCCCGGGMVRGEPSMVVASSISSSANNKRWWLWYAGCWTGGGAASRVSAAASRQQATSQNELDSSERLLKTCPTRRLKRSGQVSASARPFKQRACSVSMSRQDVTDEEPDFKG